MKYFASIKVFRNGKHVDTLLLPRQQFWTDEEGLNHLASMVTEDADNYLEATLYAEDRKEKPFTKIKHIVHKDKIAGDLLNFMKVMYEETEDYEMGRMAETWFNAPAPEEEFIR